MCGFTGWIDWTADLTKQSIILEKMTGTLANRGPDASGTWISPHCALGHRRLIRHRSRERRAADGSQTERRYVLSSSTTGSCTMRPS